MRNDNLPPIIGNVILYKLTDDKLVLVKKILRAIISKFKNLEFKEYLENDKQLGLKMFIEIKSQLPIPPFKQSLRFNNEELCKEWDNEKNLELKPEMFRAYSRFKVWWKCKNLSCMHSWRSTIGNRNRIGGGSGCPKCYENNRSQIIMISRLKNSKTIEDAFPVLIKEWDYELNKYKPNELSFKSGKRIHWKCKLGHKWVEITWQRNDRVDKSCFECRSVSQKHPSLMRFWDYEKNTSYNPKILTSGSNKLVSWRCLKGHSYRMSIKNRLRTKFPCNECKKTIKNFYPKIYGEWDYHKNDINPNFLTVCSAKKVWWLCSSKQHSWNESVHGRTRRGKYFCPKCESFAFKYPSLLDKWDYIKNKGLDPYNITCGSNRVVFWNNKNKESFRRSIKSMVKQI